MKCCTFSSKVVSYSRSLSRLLARGPDSQALAEGLAVALIILSTTLAACSVPPAPPSRDPGFGASREKLEPYPPSLPSAVSTLLERAQRVFGPEDGSLVHPAGTLMMVKQTHIGLREFALEVTVHNPQACKEKSWDFGLRFRGSSDRVLMLDIDCIGGWMLGLRTFSEGEWQNKLQQLGAGKVESLDTSSNGLNRLQLVVERDWAHLMVNGVHTATFDVSGSTGSGEIDLLAGFYVDRKSPGKSTLYEGLTVWSLPDTSDGPIVAPSPPGPEGRIVFCSTRAPEEKWSIFVVSPDGSGLRRLTGSAQGGGVASWSPNGKRLVWDGYQTDQQVALFVSNADGTGTRRLTTSPGLKMAPSWSPDGNTIAFASAPENGKHDIWIINADGTGERRLTSDRSDDKSPSWSPDSRQIAFESNRDGNTEIYVMDADGTDQRRLTNHPGLDGTPAWSPEGDKIAFASTREGRSGIYLMKPDGSNVTRITGPDRIAIFPAWSPDARKIAFSSPEGRGGDMDLFSIYTVDASGSGLTQVTTGPSADLYPRWGR